MSAGAPFLAPLNLNLMAYQRPIANIRLRTVNAQTGRARPGPDLLAPLISIPQVGTNQSCAPSFTRSLRCCANENASRFLSLAATAATVLTTITYCTARTGRTSTAR
jgi:hypothetical protein